MTLAPVFSASTCGVPLRLAFPPPTILFTPFPVSTSVQSKPSLGYAKPSRCKGRIRGERYARHWHDLAVLGRNQYFTSVSADCIVAASVARHTSLFFIEKDTAGGVIDYIPAVKGHLKIVPEGEARAALAADYAYMLADQVMLGEALAFDQLMQACSEVETQVNKAAVP